MSAPKHSNGPDADGIHESDAPARRLSLVSRNDAGRADTGDGRRDWDPFVVWRDLIKQDRDCA